MQHQKTKRIYVSFSDEDYEQIRNIAHKQNKSMSEVVRDFSIEGLNGTVGAANIDMITTIIRTQLRDVMRPSIDRLAALSAKTCVQASTAAYLTAETVARFVPDNLQLDVKDAYESARKKGVEYTRRASSEDEI